MLDRLFQLIEDEMKKYREKMLKADVAKTIQELIRSLIPPKGVCRKNIEGMELLDYCNDEETYDSDDEDGEESDDDSNVNTSVRDSDIVRKEEQTEVSVTHDGISTKGVVSLQNACSNESINKDALFVDKLGELLRSNETTTAFQPFLNRMS